MAASSDVVKVEESEELAEEPEEFAEDVESSEEPEELAEELAEEPDELWCKRTHWCCPECGQDRVSDIIGPWWSLRDLRDRIHTVLARHRRRGPWCHARLQHGGHMSCLMKIHTTLIMSLTDATQQLLGRADHATARDHAPPTDNQSTMAQAVAEADVHTGQMVCLEDSKAQADLCSESKADEDTDVDALPKRKKPKLQDEEELQDSEEEKLQLGLAQLLGGDV